MVFSESGHGKCAADGVGAVLKRTWDSHVSSGEFIDNLGDLCDLTKNVDILITTVSKEEIDRKIYWKSNLPDMKGISKCHYLKWSAQNGYLIRDLACHCKSSCGCFNPRTFNYANNCSSGGLDTFDKTNESDLTTCPELSTSSSPVVAVPLKSDDWILVGLETGDNRKKHFVAQITSRFENGDFRVRFLKQYTFRGRFNEFVDSLVTDCSVISPWEIVRKLDDPTIDRRGISVR